MNGNSRRWSGGMWRRWQIGVLAILALAGCQKQDAAAEDARQTVNQLKQAHEDGRPLAIDPNAPPITRMTATVANMLMADNNAFATASSEAGLAQVLAVDGLTTTSPVLDHCERIEALVPRAKDLAARYPAYLAVVRTEGGKLVANGHLPKAQLDELIGAMSAQQPAFNRQWTVGGELAGQAGRLCRILARRHWTNSGGALRFTDRTDEAEATAVRAKIAPLMREMSAIGSAARATSEESMKQLQGM